MTPPREKCDDPAPSPAKANPPVELHWDPEAIPPFPAVALKALNLVSGTDTSLLELCNVIRSDPAFPVAIPKMANAPLVAFSKNVNSLSGVHAARLSAAEAGGDHGRPESLFRKLVQPAYKVGLAS